MSCIYGLGSPEAYYGMLLLLEKGQHISRKDITRRLVEILYERNDTDFRRGTFRVRGDVIEVFPTYDENAYRIEMFGDEIESLAQIDPLFGTVKQKYSRLPIYPKSHYVVQPERKAEAIDSIVAELNEWVAHLEAEGRMVEAQRVHQSTRFDLEMIKSMGYCHGIENYSRHFSGRLPGEPPPTLLDYFPRDFLLFVDESHATIPQVHGMWHGDRSRKQTLVDYGFRLPSAMDNRPLKFEEFENRVHQAVYVSATPGPYELTRASRRGDRAGDPAHRACRSRGRNPAGERADRRSAGGDSRPGQAQRARAGDHADQAHGRGPGRLLHRGGRALPLHALRDRDAGARKAAGRPAQRRVRRADRHQPAARGARSARGFAGGDSRCG